MADVKRFHTELGQAGMKAATMRRVHATLHRALADAVEEGRIQANPASLPKNKLPRPDAYQFKTWSPQELQRFLVHVSRDRLYAAYFLLAYTGLRRGEGLGLSWEDVDLESGSLSVRGALIAVHHRLHWSEPKTGYGVRSVDLDRDTIAVLRAHKARQNEERLAWGPAWLEEGLVFSREDGSRVHPDWFGKEFRRQVREAGVTQVRLHDLRHTWATIAMRNGVPLKVIQERLGHHSPMFTAKQYQHVMPGMQRDAAETFASAVRDSS